MADRELALTTIKGGINRLRVKGAALNDSLYDLLNGYVSSAKTIVVRPGTFRSATLPTNGDGSDQTKGLASMNGSFHVFAAQSAVVPAGYTLHILSHPDSPDASGNVIQLKEIHFAAPFLGFLYVSAEFVGGDVFHFWLQTGSTWQASHDYKLGDIVIPSVPNGFSFQATRATPANQSWAPGLVRAVNDVIEPTVYNNFFYTVTNVLGSNPRSGTIEPNWPTTGGAQISEDADGNPVTAVAPTVQPDVSTQPAPATVARYNHIFRGRIP